MKSILAVLLSASSFCLVSARSGETQAPAGSMEHAFVQAGTARLKLSAGGYKIHAGSPDGRIHLQWKTRTQEEMQRVRVNMEVKGSEAFITARGPKNDFEVEIELPSRTDLIVDLSVGDLDIQGIEGSKRIDCHIGDLKIGIGKAQDYKEAEASVKIGDIDASPFDVRKDGFFRSFAWQGSGKYTLQANLGIGDIKLSQDR